MAKKELTAEEKKVLYDKEMAKLKATHDKKIASLNAKRARLTAKLEKKYGDDPARLEQEIGVMIIDNDAWIDLADTIMADHAKTLELKYLK